MIRLSGSLSTGTGKWLFRDVELELDEGCWNCLLGPSGVGKTTILRLIAGLESHGLFLGTIASRAGGPVPDCAYMAQQDLLMPWLNVSENVVLGARLRGEKPDYERARQLIDLVGLSDHREKTPSQLSGGMRQRAALARTLMENRELVLLDEPFSALDARTRAEMQELTHALLGERTVLLVTHDPSEAARLGDKNCILDEAGLHEAKAKTSNAILDPDKPDTFRIQTNLLQRLRKAAA